MPCRLIAQHANQDGPMHTGNYPLAENRMNLILRGVPRVLPTQPETRYAQENGT